MEFQGFRTESFQFFERLASNNTEAWVADNRDDFENFVVEPFRVLVKELAPFLAELDPALAPMEDPEEHFSRFELGKGMASDGRCYKTNFHCFFWNTELRRLADAWLFVGIKADGVSLGFSIYDSGPATKSRMSETFKPRLQTDLEILDRYIKDSYLRRGFEFHRFVRGAGRLGLRPSEPFPSRGSAWKTTLGWVVSRIIHPGSSRLTPGSFVSECQETFRRLYPLYAFASDLRPDWRDRVKM